MLGVKDEGGDAEGPSPKDHHLKDHHLLVLP